MPTKNVRRLCAIGAGMVSLSLLGVGASAVMHRRQQRQLDDVQEAVFRYLMWHYPLEDYHRVYFISTEGKADPSPAFLRRFRAVPVLPSSRMESGLSGGYLALLDKKTGRKGWHLFIGEAHWGLLTDTAADVEGGWENTRSGGNIDTFHVVRSGGEWHVTSSKTTAIM